MGVDAEKAVAPRRLGRFTVRSDRAARLQPGGGFITAWDH